jgi:signal transduction histidine kinase
LFKLFGFLENTKEINAKGIGLGLYICKKIATVFGGKVKVDSKYGEGSVFTFSFALE